MEAAERVRLRICDLCHRRGLGSGAQGQVAAGPVRDGDRERVVYDAGQHAEHDRGGVHLRLVRGARIKAVSNGREPIVIQWSNSLQRDAVHEGAPEANVPGADLERGPQLQECVVARAVGGPDEDRGDVRADLVNVARVRELHEYREGNVGSARANGARKGVRGGAGRRSDVAQSINGTAAADPLREEHVVAHGREGQAEQLARGREGLAVAHDAEVPRSAKLDRLLLTVAPGHVRAEAPARVRATGLAKSLPDVLHVLDNAVLRTLNVS